MLDLSTSIRLFRTRSFLSFSRLADSHFADCMTCLTTQRILSQFEQILHFRQFLASAYMIDLATWWIAHGSLGKETQTVFHLGLVSLFLCLTALKLGTATSFFLLYIHSFLSFNCLAGTQFADCIAFLATQRVSFQ